MGYELNKLMNRYGVSTPGAVAYSGPMAPAGDAPVAPTAPAALADNATRAQKTQYDKDLAAYNTAMDTYNKDKAAFDETMRKYQLGQKEYNQYRQEYMGRLGGGSMYNAPQFTGAFRPEDAAKQVSYTDKVAAPTYGAVPASLGAKTPEEKAAYYKRMRDLGYTDADIRGSTTKTFGAINEGDWRNLLNKAYPTYQSAIEAAYGTLGRSGYGSSVANIDDPGYNYWANQLISGNVTPDKLNKALYDAANNWMPTLEYDVSKLPKEFDWAYYVNKYPDLAKAGIDTNFEAARHYYNYGMNEGRSPYEGWTAPKKTIPADPSKPGGGTTTCGPGYYYNTYFNQCMPIPDFDGGIGGGDGVGGGDGSVGGELDKRLVLDSRPDLAAPVQVADTFVDREPIYKSPYVDTTPVFKKPTTPVVPDRTEDFYSGMSDYLAPVPVSNKLIDLEPIYGGGGRFDDFGANYMLAKHGGSVHKLANKYKVGGAVRRFRLGGDEGEPDVQTFPVAPQPELVGVDLPQDTAPPPMTRSVPAQPVAAAPVTESPAAQPIEPKPAATTPVSPAATDLLSMVQKYSGESMYGKELEAARKRVAAENAAFSSMIEKAMKGDDEPVSKAELYFRLAAAFGAPTKTGQFMESVAGVSKELGEYAKEQRASKKAQRQLGLQLGIEAQKLKTQAARDELGTLRTLAGEELKDKREILKEYIKSGMPQSEAGKIAKDMGLTPGTKEYNDYVNKYVERKLESGELYKQAMLAIGQGNLAIAQSRESRATEQATRLTPAEIKLKSEAETTIGGLDDAMTSLKRAYSLNPNTFEGTWASIAQQKILEQTDPKDPRVLATREQRNLLGKGAIERLKASFGGNPTEGERAALLELEGLDAKSKEERARIMKNTYKLLQARRNREQKRLNDISAGLYRETTPSAGDIE